MSDLIGFDAAADYPTRLRGLLSAGIGLWDVLHICDRPGSLDSAIVRDTMEVNDFGALFLERPGIARVFFNGVKAEQLFGRLVAPGLCVPIDCTRLPSTSPANAAVSYNAKLAAWRAVLDVG